MSNYFIGARVRLLKKIDNDKWSFCSSGYLSPNPIKKGQRVWVGSISSRDGYRTTEITDVLISNLHEAAEFKTQSGSHYLVISFDSNDFDTIRGETV